MNKFKCIVIFIIACQYLYGQVPEISLKDAQGKFVKLDEITKNDGPVLVCFWATWCKPCINELDNISEVFEDWQTKTKVKIIAISVDDSRSTAKAPGVAKTRGWQYQVLLDPNNDAMRSFNVIDVPHSFLYDSKGKLVWQHTGYLAGDEDKLFQEINKLINK